MGRIYNLRIGATVAPWFEETWNYTDLADALNEPHILEKDPGGNPMGEIRLTTGLSNTPWGGTTALERHFYGYGDDGSVGFSIYPHWRIGQAQESFREAWFEVYIKWDSNWDTTDPQGSDDKTIQYHEAKDGQWGGGINRWVTRIGTFGHDFSIETSFIDNYDPPYDARHWLNPANYDPPNEAMSSLCWDGEWHLYRWHLKMSSGVGVKDGVHEAWFDNLKVRDLTVGVDTESYNHDDFELHYFASVGLGRNATINDAASCYFGRMRIYTQDPGWPAGDIPVAL
jgi:hypothetical protein